MTAVECRECGYRWNYSGGLSRATCPNCLLKTPVAATDGDTEIVVAGDEGVILGERDESAESGPTDAFDDSDERA